MNNVLQLQYMVFSISKHSISSSMYYIVLGDDAHNSDVPYSGKVSREKTHGLVGSDHICGENFRAMLKPITGWYEMPKFCGENFCGWLQNGKIRKRFLPWKFCDICTVFLLLTLSCDSECVLISNVDSNTYHCGFANHSVVGNANKVLILSHFHK